MRGQGATLGKRAGRGLRKQQAFFANEEDEQGAAFTPGEVEAGDDALAPQAGQFRRGQGLGREKGQQRGLNRRRCGGSCLSKA